MPIFCFAPDLADLPAYKPEYSVVGRLRIVGSELKNSVDGLVEGFRKFHPDAKVVTNYMTSSEGAIAGLYFDQSDVAPAGDDAKITDQMPFFNTFGYMPTEISVATGGYEKRGSLWAFAAVVSKDNPLNEISIDELERCVGVAAARAALAAVAAPPWAVTFDELSEARTPVKSSAALPAAFATT